VAKGKTDVLGKRKGRSQLSKFFTRLGAGKETLQKKRLRERSFGKGVKRKGDNKGRKIVRVDFSPRHENKKKRRLGPCFYKIWEGGGPGKRKNRNKSEGKGTRQNRSDGLNDIKGNDYQYPPKTYARIFRRRG